MKTKEIKFKTLNTSYSILVGNNILNLLSNKIKILCPQSKKIALIFDEKVPVKFKTIIMKNLRNYKIYSFKFNANEKSKSIGSVTYFLDNLFSKNFNRSDLVISVGGGITGDLVGFVSSIFKRGINFINIPTTLLSQVDASIGGKTGVNSKFGKNLIGSFAQPKLVLSDIAFLKSLSKKEMICGYAEILKHAVIIDKKFFNWLKRNTKFLFENNKEKLIYAIQQSCKIKLSFVSKDLNEKNLRMILNFGHTFAHAIEVKNNYSKNITHGEAVLIGMILAAKISVINKLCSKKTLEELIRIYKLNKIDYVLNNYSTYSQINSLIPFLKNDKKNNDEKINFIFLKKIGKTTLPNQHKISIKTLKKKLKILIDTDF